MSAVFRGGHLDWMVLRCLDIKNLDLSFFINGLFPWKVLCFDIVYSLYCFFIFYFCVFEI